MRKRFAALPPILALLAGRVARAARHDDLPHDAFRRR